MGSDGEAQGGASEQDVAITPPAPQADAVDTCAELSDPRAERIVQYTLKGWTYGQIADELKVTPQTVYRLRIRYGLDEIVEGLTQELARQTAQGYIAMRQVAIKTAIDLMEHGSEEIKERAMSKALKYMGERGDVPDERPPHRRDLPDDADLAGALRNAINAGGHRSSG